MTKRQSEVYGFITDFVERKGYSPTLRQIGIGVGLSSLATVHKHLKNLERTGYISRDHNRASSIRIAGACPYCGHEEKQKRKVIHSVPRGTFSGGVNEHTDNSLL